jgi:two-component system sensor histidine kinase/response regulator
MENQNREKPLILIVDDNPANIQLLSNIVSIHQYDAAIATNGYKALEIAQSYSPDLILLDISMPGIDGYEVCSRLKADENTSNIPVIFITCFTGQDEIIRGFQAGAVDYITKPFHTPELTARIKTHLQLKFYREKIEEDKISLEKLNKQLTEFLAIAIHDLKVPLGNISMIAKMIRDFKDMPREEIEELSGDIITSSDRMLRIIVDLLNINAVEEGKIKVDLEETSIGDLMNEVFFSFKEKADEKNITLNWQPLENQINATTDRKAFLHIMDNLVSNAIKFTPLGKSVSLSVKDQGEEIAVAISDEGPGFTDDDKAKMYQRFQRLSAQPTADENSSGLGLSIVKLYVELIKAEIELESEAGNGATFKIILPKTIAK